MSHKKRIKEKLRHNVSANGFCRSLVETFASCWMWIARAFRIRKSFDKLLAYSEKDATDFIAYCVSGMVKHRAQKAINAQLEPKRSG